MLCFQRLCLNKNGQLTGVDMCYNDKGDIVKQGEQYFPLGSDVCTQCTCLNGRPEMCISVLCSPPQQCRQFHAVNGKCCEFVCLDGDFGANSGIKILNTSIIRGTGGDNRTHGSVTTNSLGLRLIASTITSFLILALLLFMIHRLRQRRLLLMIRRLQTRRLEQVNGLSAENPNLGYLNEPYEFGGSFTEPPPPYTLWKPPEQYIPPGEAPPPYDDSLGVTVVPCFDQSFNNNNNNNSYNNGNGRVNIANYALGSPTPFQQTQLLTTAANNRPTLYVRSSPFLSTGSTATTTTTLGAPIVDTISSDGCYEHITIVRINDTPGNTVTILSNSDNTVGYGVGGDDNRRALCESNSMSSIASTSSSSSSTTSSTRGDPLQSPTNCSVSSSSTSTQSTVRHQDNNHTISRL
ncbi:integral membrane protein DGCR2/IDD-like isoform X2 [Oppia nitens]|uniref:integral membrane protein DGCR2/IDD-like isoform X2 n=1 Tax=Oppia nitens TaxID=1686743 RepID=UPI0023DA5D31|nr:integral membrane protein DGCR2/IDD-like isoform X2 [Oppia nitens]